MRVIDQHTLYESPFFHAAFPAIAQTKDGSLLLSFRRGRDPLWLLGKGATRGGFGLSHIDPRSHLVTLRLDPASLAVRGDARVVEIDPEAADQDASLLVTKAGRVLLGSFCWYSVPSAATSAVMPGFADGEAIAVRAPTHITTFQVLAASMRVSDDNGLTFSVPRHLPPVDGVDEAWTALRPSFRAGLRGAFVERDGEILVCTYDGHTGRERVRIFVSDDGGETFTHRAAIDDDPSGRAALQEPALFCTVSGTLVVFCRTTGAGDSLMTARSADGGVTWTPWERQTAIGHPYNPLQLRDGRVLLTYGYRHAPYGIRARILDAECTNIDEAEEFIVRSDGQGTDLGYPWAVQLPDGDVLVVYYWSNERDGRVIAASRIALE